MKQRILWTRPDGGMSITAPGEDVARTVLKIQRDRPDWQLIAMTVASAIPQSRAFRDQWEFADGAISVCLPAARRKKMKDIRKARNALLRETDKEFLRALECGPPPLLQELKGTRQMLRDLPESIDLSAISTSDALDEYWPTELEEKIDKLLEKGG